MLENSDLIVLDEPTSFIDEDSKKIYLELIRSIKNNKIILIVTHDNDFDEISGLNIKF